MCLAVGRAGVPGAGGGKGTRCDVPSVWLSRLGWGVPSTREG